MIIGVPREIKDSENRVSTTPAGVVEYVSHGHQVLVERSAGAASGFPDAEYAAAGATIVDSAAEVYARADLIAKVKEPIAAEYPLLRDGQILYTYLHLAADAALTQVLVERRVTAIAYETVQLDNGALPLLAPMSEVAGRMAPQVGAQYLSKTYGGRGLLLGEVAGVPSARVVVVGGGMVGTNAAEIALGMGADVTVIDINIDRLRALEHILHGRFHTLASSRHNIAEAVREADLVIGAVLIPGARAPRLVTQEMVASMRPGSVIVDVAIDQGGCIETSRPTSHTEPVFVEHGVIHYCVTNMPGAVPRTSTFALSNVTLPYGLKLADLGVAAAVACDQALARGVNVYGGYVTNAPVAEALGMSYTPLSTLITNDQDARAAGVEAA